ncbi:hypothetical protein EVG20_g6875 [Dentipellis fragilis]|uniref:Uncharacterized protein n=1 Tax=Dentipellis fragilis TaxID=205917 RepID=A0A4Y9YKD0_9AGAM|nr:hypothetical protein EVG20_g6875 [Dentipellis fragilis]
MPTPASPHCRRSQSSISYYARNRERLQEYQRAYVHVKRIGRRKTSKQERQLEESIRMAEVLGDRLPYTNTIVLSHHRADPQRTPEMAEEEHSTLVLCSQMYAENVLAEQDGGIEAYRAAVTDLLDGYLRKARQASSNQSDGSESDRRQYLHGIRRMIAGLHQERSFSPRAPACDSKLSATMPWSFLGYSLSISSDSSLTPADLSGSVNKRAFRSIYNF